MISEKNILDLKTRQEIYEVVSENPGIHIRKISQMKDIPLSTLTHHLSFLEKTNLIEIPAYRNNKRIYIQNGRSKREKELLNLLKEEATCWICLHLIFSLSFSTKELAKELRIHPSTVYLHLKKMLEIGLIEPTVIKDGKTFPFNDNGGPIIKDDIDRERFYRMKDQELLDCAYKLIIKCKERMLDPNFMDNCIALREEQSKNGTKKVMNFDKAVANFVKELEEIFPSPFHL